MVPRPSGKQNAATLETDAQKKRRSAHERFKELIAGLPTDKATQSEISLSRTSLSDFLTECKKSGLNDYKEEAVQLITCLDVMEFKSGYRSTTGPARLLELKQHLKGASELSELWAGWVRTAEIGNWSELLLQAHAIRRAKSNDCKAECTREKLTTLFRSSESDKTRLARMVDLFQPADSMKADKKNPAFAPRHDSPEGGEGGDGGDGGGGV